MKTNYQRMFMAASIALLASGTPLLASETDQQIESSFKDSYVSQNYLKGDAVKAESKEGVVTLSGTVNDASHKSLAQDTAENLAGVKSVDNRVEVKAASPAETPDAWLAVKVNAALLFHRNVSMANTRVDVKDGVVTLTGEAANAAQKDLTTEYAKVEGVKEVKNEMTVAAVSAAPKKTDQTMKEKIDDASITAQVKTALLFHGATSALKTSVTTKDGVVTVSGKAANAAEKDLVTELVKDIHGVKDIVNKMTLE